MGWLAAPLGFLEFVVVAGLLFWVLFLLAGDSNLGREDWSRFLQPLALWFSGFLPLSMDVQRLGFMPLPRDSCFLESGTQKPHAPEFPLEKIFFSHSAVAVYKWRVAISLA